MDAILTSVGLVVAKCIEWVGDWMSCITAQPLLMLFILLPLVGIGVGFIKRLVRI